MIDPDAAPPLSLLDGAALFLDFDGTLVELAEAPDAIHVPTGLTDLLERVAKRLQGRLAIISGRALTDLDRHLSLTGLAVSGSHGLELRLADGRHLPLAVSYDTARLKAEVEGFAESESGLLVEEKPASIALHYRQAPEREESVLGFVTALAERRGLTVQRGKMVAELRPAGADKGAALRALMAEPAFAGARPVFVGDDLTDENAFEAARSMGGAGILVGPVRPSAATFRLPDVTSVARWIEAAAAT